MKQSITLVLLCLLAIGSVSAAFAQPNEPQIQLFFRRATFDPLRSLPTSSLRLPSQQTSLILIQFDSAPTSETQSRLESLSLQPLMYIPNNALLVRASHVTIPSRATLPGLRWSGALPLAYKLAPELDHALDSTSNEILNLQILVARDADINQVIRDITSGGGNTTNRSTGANGSLLRVALPAHALSNVLQRDDILWIERAATVQVFNDRARTILGVATAHQQFPWLDGSGQVIAITDTGLDVQNSVLANSNPDFAAGRLIAAFTPSQMDSTCIGLSNADNWSDRNGHGTHVIGSAVGGGRTPAFAGIAPAAGFVIQAVSTGGSSLDCLALNADFLLPAYQAGARIQNASWGISSQHGQYTTFEQDVDDFLWQHKDHLLVIAAGNDGVDSNPRDGVTDANSITSPATAKNVLTVGASENNRPPMSATCVSLALGRPQEDQCYGAAYGAAPIAVDFVSDNVDGMAAFSGRGPSSDGRIKPEISAPGTNIISTASHDPDALYAYGRYNADYAFDSGTSMATPMVSGMAALVRQWLATQRQTLTPSAALIKALLLNGTTDMSPGQYGTGAFREIPAAWPNNIEGWGRATMTDTIGLANDSSIWFADTSGGLQTNESASYSLQVTAGQPLRISLAWTDYPASPLASRALVNDLDLDVQDPNGQIWRGNASAALASNCRDTTTSADRCNNVETVLINAPTTGIYIVRVHGTSIPQGPQPFALAAHGQSITDTTLAAPVLQAISNVNQLLTLNWNAISGATYYEVYKSNQASFIPLQSLTPTTTNQFESLANPGTYWFRVRACTPFACGPVSNAQSINVSGTPLKRIFFWMPSSKR